MNTASDPVPLKPNLLIMLAHRGNFVTAASLFRWMLKENVDGKPEYPVIFYSPIDKQLYESMRGTSLEVPQYDQYVAELTADEEFLVNAGQVYVNDSLVPMIRFVTFPYDYSGKLRKLAGGAAFICGHVKRDNGTFMVGSFLVIGHPLKPTSDVDVVYFVPGNSSLFTEVKGMFEQGTG